MIVSSAILFYHRAPYVGIIVRFTKVKSAAALGFPWTGSWPPSAGNSISSGRF